MKLSEKCRSCGKHTYTPLGKWIRRICITISIIIVCFLLVFCSMFVFRNGTVMKSWLKDEMKDNIELRGIINADLDSELEDCLTELCVADRLTAFVYDSSTFDMVCRHRAYVLNELLHKEGIDSDMRTFISVLFDNDDINMFGHAVVDFKDKYNTTWICDPMNHKLCLEENYYIDEDLPRR